jgi:hypothetical protein
MTYVPEIEVVQGDKLFDIFIQCQKADGSGENLTGWSEILLRVYEAGASVSKISTTSNITMDTESTGLMHYTVQASDFDTKKDYNADVRVTFTSGKILTFTGLSIIVKEHGP